ncbi:MAG TPA: hypothetical protein VLJ61_04635 [Pyrinomonadaceae bacterium]|nr:hypothetical protein [Pyrinomonadaceae bacterium]
MPEMLWRAKTEARQQTTQESRAEGRLGRELKGAAKAEAEVLSSKFKVQS